MFKFKLWLTPLLFLVAGALLLVSGTTFLHEELLPAYENEVQNLKIGVKGQLLVDAARAVERAAALTQRPDVRAALEGEGEVAPDVLLGTDKKGRQPVFVVLATAAGKVVASAGEHPFGDAVQGVPEFAEALTGVVRDGFARLGDRSVQLAAAPVVTGQKAIGGVLMGFALDGLYADKLQADIGRPVYMLNDGKRQGSALKMLSDEEAAKGLSEGTVGKVQLDLPLPFPLPIPLPILVPESGRFQTGVVQTFGGKSPILVVAVDRTSALRTIALAQIWVVGAALLLAVFMTVIVLSILRSISKPMEVIMDHLSAFAQGSAVGILPEAALAGPFVRLGKQINMILQAPPPGAAPRSGVPPVSPVSAPFGMLGETSGPFSPPPAPPMDDSSDLDAQFPGLGEGSGAISPSPSYGAPPGFPPGPPPMESSGPIAPVSRPPVSDDLANSGLAGLFDDGAADPLAAFRVGGPVGGGARPPQPPPQSQPPTFVPPPQGAAPLPGMGGGPPMAPPPTNPGAGDMNPDATVMFQVPQELIQESAASATGGPVMGMGGPRGAPPPPMEDRTVVAQVPSELLSAAAPRPDVNPSDDAHYREVYQEFIRVRQQCGEDTDQLTYDRFVAKLLKNRQQIVEKYNSRSVRFQVYVKQGKAALRAVPVRE